MPHARPWRNVAHATGPCGDPRTTIFQALFWVLRLECGHDVQRYARGKEQQAPTRVRCEECETQAAMEGPGNG